MTVAQRSVEEQPGLSSHATFRARLDEIGKADYHHRHPFNLLMHSGMLAPDDLRLWVANRYYYQQRIPIKDALILAKSEDVEFRRVWVQRLRDHDGAPDQPGAFGGLELWVRLGRGVGLTREELDAQTHLLPGVKRACDEYVELVRSAELVTAVAASLTERYAARLMLLRLQAWKLHYSWIEPTALEYFERRVARAKTDADFALCFVELHAKTQAQQERCLAAFAKKCEILWRLLDAVYLSRRWSLAPRLAPHTTLTNLNGPTNPEASLLLAPERGFELNAIARELVQCCDGATALEEIGEKLAREHGVSIEQVRSDVGRFLAELELRRLLSFQKVSA